MKYKLTSFLKGKKILVTGGTGSIGESLVKKAILDGAKSVKVFSNDENSLFEMEEEYGLNKKIQFVIGDIRDYDTVESLVKGIEIVFHAAALKHVDRCELYPFEAVMVNIIGTKHIVKSAIEEKVKKVSLHVFRSHRQRQKESRSLQRLRLYQKSDSSRSRFYCLRRHRSSHR